MNLQPTPSSTAAEIRRILKRGGSRQHARGVQRFFKEEIQSRGWYTGDLRRLARGNGRSIVERFGMDFLVAVANQLFSGRILEEKIFAVLLLEEWTEGFDDSHFALFASWIERITSWADHDSLAHYLIAPMITARPERARSVFAWAKSSHRWHRRAACVALIHSSRQKKLFPQIARLTKMLLEDEDDMVQKGLGWLLRETAKADPIRTLPYLLRIRHRVPRLVLRTACETLSPALRRRVLASEPKARFNIELRGSPRRRAPSSK